MTIIATRADIGQQEPPRQVRLLFTNSTFINTFEEGYIIGMADNSTLTDDTIYKWVQDILSHPQDDWRQKAGKITGWFAGVYHVSYTFEGKPVPPKPMQPRFPQTTSLCYNDPDFPTYYTAGRDSAASHLVTTDRDLSDKLTEVFVFNPFSVRGARFAASYIAGFMAGLFGVWCHIEEQPNSTYVAHLERAHAL